MIPYVVSKLAIALISPLGTALLLWLVGLLLLATARRAAISLLVLGLGWLWLWSTPVVSDSLLHHLEHRYPPRLAAALPRADAIVVLGGAVAPPGRGMPYPNLSPAADRIWHAARVFRAGKAPILVASGGSDPALAAVPEAQVIAGLLQELGVPAAAILQERDSRTTYENAQFTARLLQDRHVRGSCS
ncbi:YdcF family protein [Ramlibacter ginsenosidimutans]|uniref:YdcF family protein n=1 Tax=Ramlibacter ginsenosidimutans TaxID=502333 RepID=A0A934TSC5_9BURK|nr:YdcF family protein [Ramlibacter ginsenosidimutans]MBK6006701.1 YdcF family protein [Ramlibacter ginsenosidimutans]